MFLGADSLHGVLKTLLVLGGLGSLDRRAQLLRVEDLWIRLLFKRQPEDQHS